MELRYTNGTLIDDHAARKLTAAGLTTVAVSIDGGREQVFENQFREYDRTWKDQVMRNGAPCRLTFAVDKGRKSHRLTFRALDAGQMLQRVIIDWGGLRPSYLGPAPERK